MFILLTVFCFATFYDSGSAFAQSVLTVPIEGRLIIPDGTAAGNLDITLNGDLYSTMSRSDGSFTFHEIPTGKLLGNRAVRFV